MKQILVTLKVSFLIFTIIFSTGCSKDSVLNKTENYLEDVIDVKKDAEEISKQLEEKIKETYGNIEVENDDTEEKDENEEVYYHSSLTKNKDDGHTYEIIIDGDYSCYMGMFYNIEEFKNGSWQWVDVGDSFRPNIFIVNKNEPFRGYVNTDPLENGYYRIEKRMYDENGVWIDTDYIEFEIKK